MAVFGSGFALEAMRLTANALAQRRANREYWNCVRTQRSTSLRRHDGGRHTNDLGSAIEDQLDLDVYRASTRRCPQCHDTFVLITVRNVEMDTCLSCISFWLDAGEFGELTAHSLHLLGQPCGTASSNHCPVCGRSMRRYQLHPNQRLHVDVCNGGHGMYFERDNLFHLLTDMTEQ